MISASFWFWSLTVAVFISGVTFTETPNKFLESIKFEMDTASHGEGQRESPAAVFKLDNKKWIIEHQRNNPDLIIDQAEMSHVIYLYKCENSTITVKGKLNSITMDSCKKTSIIFDSLISVMEFINCQSVEMQVVGNVPAISVVKTDGCQIYLSAGSLDAQIVSCKSSEMNVMVPNDQGDYFEQQVPEQFKTIVDANGKLKTVCLDVENI